MTTEKELEAPKPDVNKLVTALITPKEKDSSGVTCLFKACSQGNQTLMQCVAVWFASMFLSKLFMFWFAGITNMALELLENGADITTKCNGSTCLHEAASQGHAQLIESVLKWLYGQGWSINDIHQKVLEVYDKEGHTPLHKVRKQLSQTCGVVRCGVLCGM